MILLAIDPGPEQSAYVLLEDAVIKEFGIVPNSQLRQICREPVYDQRVIEMVASYGMPVGKEVFETCVWIGRFIEAGHGPSYRLTRKEVCLHLCNSPRGNDATVRQAVIDRYGGKTKAIGGKKCPACKGKGRTGRQRRVCLACRSTGWEVPPGPLKGVKGDIWQALALGLTHLDLTPSGQVPAMHGKNSQSTVRGGLPGTA